MPGFIIYAAINPPHAGSADDGKPRGVNPPMGHGASVQDSPYTPILDIGGSSAKPPHISDLGHRDKRKLYVEVKRIESSTAF